MKKLATLLLAGSAIALASCGNNENNTTTEQIDSMATYRTDTMQAALQAQNDSLIAAMAQMRADSAMRADSMARMMVTTKTTTTTTRPAKTTKPTTKAQTPATKQEDKFNTRGNSDAPISKEKAKEQEDKFNRR